MWVSTISPTTTSWMGTRPRWVRTLEPSATQGSSMIKTVAPLPVMPPPTPAATYPPRWLFRLHSSALWLLGFSRMSNTGWNVGSSRTSFTFFEKDIARETLYEQAMISWSGLRPRCQEGNARLHSSLFPERGGMSSISRGLRPLATSSLNFSRRRQMSLWTQPAR